MFIPRLAAKYINDHLAKKEPVALIVYGPRQAGKTTLIERLISDNKLDVQKFTGDDLDAQRLLGLHSLENLKKIITPGKIIVVDEAQKIDNVGLTFKLLIDNFQSLILTSGSASFDLANKLNEPLTGRSYIFWLYPLSYAELKEKYNAFTPARILSELLIYGSYPKVHILTTLAEKEEYLRNYLNNYLYKDILSLGQIRKPKLVLDLLSLLALQIGQEVKISELAKTLRVTAATVNSYLEVLEKMFIIFEIRGFSRNLRKEIAKSSKFYFWDLGLRNALIRNFNSLEVRTDAGQLMENFFIAEKFKAAENFQRLANFYFWRTYDQQEIDLVEDRGGELLAYEVKFSPSKKHKAPSAWTKAYPASRVVVVNSENFVNYLL